MFAIGKLPPEILEKIVMEPMQASRVKREDVILRPKTGEDCSAVDLGGEYCILSTDPITGAAKDVGYLAVQINCNDIYSSGAEPMGVLLTVLLPPESEEALLEEMDVRRDSCGGGTQYRDSGRSYRGDGCSCKACHFRSSDWKRETEKFFPPAVQRQGRMSS